MGYIIHACAHAHIHTHLGFTFHLSIRLYKGLKCEHTHTLMLMFKRMHMLTYMHTHTHTHLGFTLHLFIPL